VAGVCADEATAAGGTTGSDGVSGYINFLDSNEKDKI
jgi:hypothetical protein